MLPRNCRWFGSPLELFCDDKVKMLLWKTLRVLCYRYFYRAFSSHSQNFSLIRTEDESRHIHKSKNIMFFMKKMFSGLPLSRYNICPHTSGTYHWVYSFTWWKNMGKERKKKAKKNISTAKKKGICSCPLKILALRLKRIQKCIF